MGAYLAFGESPKHGGRSILAKAFSTNFHIVTSQGFVYLNGAQLTKIETVAKGDNWDVTFYLPDGSSHTVAANAWTKKFVADILEGLGLSPTGGKL
jgi:hypothetical protein